MYKDTLMLSSLQLTLLESYIKITNFWHFDITGLIALLGVFVGLYLYNETLGKGEFAEIWGNIIFC